MENVQYTITDGRGEIVLSRPDVLNAFTDEMIESLNSTLERAHCDDDVYAIVLTGEGRGFCTGADTSMLDDASDRLDSATGLWKVQNVVRQLYFGPKPVVAAVNGPAIGAGCDFALACDLRVMSEDAYLREQFVNIGLVPGDGGGWLLPRLVGESKAKEYILTGKDITPAEAEDAGLVTEVVPNSDTLDAARNLADRLVDRPALAMQNCKHLIDGTRSFEEYRQQAIEHQWECRNDTEQSEAIAALRDGREPNYDRGTGS